MLVKLLTLLIRCYQKCISPFLGSNCRFYPSCSEYAKIALERHGFWRGLGLAIRRVGRCHPLSEGGIDHVPEKQPSRKD